MCKVTVKRQLTNVKNKKSNVQIQRFNDNRLFMQVSTILREFIGMTTISQVTILSLAVANGEPAAGRVRFCRGTQLQ